MFRILDPKTGFDLLGPYSDMAPEFLSAFDYPKGFSEVGARLHFAIESVSRMNGVVVRTREESHAAIPFNTGRLPEAFLDRISDGLNYEASETGALKVMLDESPSNAAGSKPWASKLESLYGDPE